jgi:DEAD/DEAH box helicase domain-containing protein
MKTEDLSSDRPPIGTESSHQYAEQLLNHLKTWEKSDERIIAQHQVPALSAQFVAAPTEIKAILPPGVTQLYTHQLQAFEMANRGEPLTIATATASGKTYAMALPARLKQQHYPNATLLCVAPTRALIEQWKERLLSWNPTVCVETYTGDTPKDQKPAIRARAQYLITTPDTLHMGILPYHRGWSRFFMHLQDVIIDESHLDYGVFGSHFSLILRRLQRVAGIYRPESPSFFFGSATIGNPDDHATHLLGRAVSAITESGAPSGGRFTLLWQPPDNRTHNQEAAYLMSFFIRQGVRCILFGQARQSVEKMLRQVKDLIRREDQGKVMAYRAGYSKEDRHHIERCLASGELLGVISTSALEVGIDLGNMDVSILAGFPGGISSYKQQAGRAGRRNRSALSILVLRDDALDQYFAQHPQMLLDAPAEKALINISNPYILPAHLLCAAHEKPLRKTDLPLFGPAAFSTIQTLVDQNKLVEVPEGTFRLPLGSKSIAYMISLRNVGKALSIFSEGKKLEDTNLHYAITECHPGAIYYSQGTSYLVTRLDLTSSSINAVKGEMGYETQAIVHTDVEIHKSEQKKSWACCVLHSGQVVVTREVSSYMKKNRSSKEEIGICELPEPLSAPLRTKAMWITFPQDLIDATAEKGYDTAGSLHAVEHCMIALLPLFVLGDRRDVGGVSMLGHHQTDQATIFIYDGYPGGVGYSEEAYQKFDELGKATLEVLKACPCVGGCNKCIYSPKCGNQNRPLDKAGAIFVLEQLLLITTETSKREKTEEYVVTEISDTSA